MKQEFIHKEFMDNILSGPSISKHDKPKKLMIMLHGYGDNAANFIYLAEPLDQDEWGMHYVALNAPNIMPGNPMGYQWFDLYINGVYISDAGPKEYKIIDDVITANVTKIKNTIDIILQNMKLSMNDCFIMGFSQGGIMAFELGRSLTETLGVAFHCQSRNEDPAHMGPGRREDRCRTPPSTVELREREAKTTSSEIAQNLRL